MASETRAGGALCCRRMVMAISATCLIAGAVPRDAYGQASDAIITPGQVTPPSFQPQPQVSARLPALTPSPQPLPPGADRLDVLIGPTTVDGGFAQLRSRETAITAAIDGRRVTVLNLFETAATIEREYASAGFPLVRVVVPPQKLMDGGPVRFMLVDGFVERIEVTGLPPNLAAHVRDRLAGLLGRRGLTQGELERHVLLAGNLPGLQLRSALSPGIESGGTVLSVEGSFTPAALTLTGDSRFAPSLGRYSLNTGLTANNAFGLGEQSYLSLISGPNVLSALNDARPARIFGFGATIPIGTDGWTINPEVTLSRTRPNTRAEQPEAVGSLARFSLRTAYPLILSRGNVLNITGALEAVEESNRAPAFNTPLFKDRYGVMRIGASWQASYDDWLTALPASISMSMTYSHGLGGRDERLALGSGVPLSRSGAEPVFDTVQLNLRDEMVLPAGLQLVMIAQGQTGFGSPVLRSEQFYMDGSNGISGVYNGAFGVDQGATLRAELSHPFLLPDGSTVSPYGFAAAGVGFNERPIAGERARYTVSEFGVGLRASRRGPVTPTIGLEVGRVNDGGSGAHLSGWQFIVNFSLTY